MVRIVIILVVLLLLAGGGYVGWQYFSTGDTPLSADRDSVPIGPDPTDPFARYDPDQGVAPNFVELKPFFIPVFQGKRITRHVELIVSVQASDGESLPVVQASANRLQASYLRELTNYINLLYSETGDIDLYYIKRRLLYVGRRDLGEDKLHDVLIRHVFVRRIS